MRRRLLQVVEFNPGWSVMLMSDDWIMFVRRDGLMSVFTYKELGF